MSARPYVARVELDVKVPVTRDGYWRLLLALDDKGPFTAGDLRRGTLKNAGTPSEYLRLLKAGGFVKQVGERLTAGKNPQEAPLYRLTQRPLDAPRLNRKGEVLPEHGIERIWRAMKMAKTWTVNELVELMSGGGAEPVNRNTVYNYSTMLAQAGIVTRAPNGKSRDARYRLVRNVGARAPKILAGKVVYDPNVGEIVGAMAAREVSP